MKSYSIQYEWQRHGTGTSRLNTPNIVPIDREGLVNTIPTSLLNINFRLSGFQSLLLPRFTSATVRVSVYPATNTYPISDDPLSRTTQRNFVPLQKPYRNHRPYGMVFVGA